uniref:Interleukin-17 receptor B n=1 Tax=Haemonchus contortus TaxID=6289 RepID=A0A7I4YNK7_HAECO
MHPQRVFVSPLLWFLLCFQVYTALSCTFKHTTAANVSWNYMNYVGVFNSPSCNGCLEMGKFPDCAMVGVQAGNPNCQCYIYNHRSSPVVGSWSSSIPSIVLYKLEREEVDVKCPLAVDVLI